MAGPVRILGQELYDSDPSRYPSAAFPAAPIPCALCGNPACVVHVEPPRPVSDLLEVTIVATGRTPAQAKAAASSPTSDTDGLVLAEDPNVAQVAVAEGGTPSVAEAVAAAGGASNGHDEVAGGMHAASVAADVALAASLPGPMDIPSSFARTPGGMLRATRDIQVRFVPKNCTTPSTIMLAAAGTEWAESVVLARLALYRDAVDLQVL